MSNKQRRITFGKWLKSQRESVHLTQMDLARQLNYENPQIISNIERGFSALPSRRVDDFARALKCNSLELEVRRVLSASKDDVCAEALETVLVYLPIIDIIRADAVNATEVVGAVSQFRMQRGLSPLIGSTHSAPVLTTAEA